MGVMPGIGGSPMRAVLASLAYVNKASSTSDASTYTFNSQPFGAADPDRWVVVAIGTNCSSDGVRDETGVTTPTGVTIGGVAARRLSSGEHAQVLDGVGQGTSIWAAYVPAGTTGQIVVNFSQSMRRLAAYIYRMIRDDSVVAAKGYDRVLGGGTQTVTAPSPVRQFGIIVGHRGDSSSVGTLSISGTGVTQNANDILETGSAFGAAQFTPSVGNITVTASPTNAGTISCWASF
jgi:hypothetical protein